MPCCCVRIALPNLGACLGTVPFHCPFVPPPHPCGVTLETIALMPKEEGYISIGDPQLILYYFFVVNTCSFLSLQSNASSNWTRVGTIYSTS